MNLPNSFSRKNVVTNSKGFTLPMVLLFVLAFLAAPLLFWFADFKSKGVSEVQGARTDGEREGLYVKVNSTSGSWELFEYLCKSKEECLASLESGKKYEAISGGVNSMSSIKIDYTDAFKDFEYLKLFVKPRWGNMSGAFIIENADKIMGVQQKALSNVQVLILPVSFTDSSEYTTVTFVENK